MTGLHDDAPRPQGEDAYDTALLALSRLAVADIEDPDAVLQQAGAIVAATLRVARVGVWSYLPGRTGIKCVHLYEHGRLEPHQGTILSARDFPAFFAAIAQARTVVVFDRDHDAMAGEMREAYLDPLSIYSLLDAPVYQAGEMVALICHEHTGAPRVWSALERKFAASVADIAGRLFEEAEHAHLKRTSEQAESTVFAQEQVGALGQLAVGIAHDFRNLLHVTLACAELIREAAPDNTVVLDAVADIETVVDAATRLTGGLVDYGRTAGQQPRVVRVEEAVQRALPLLRLVTGGRHALRIAADAPTSRVLIDPLHIERLLVNLIANARDASDAGGPITVGIAEGRRRAAAGGYSPTHVILEVRDNGCGIPADQLQRVRQPYFTTKPDGGTGLGLAIVDEIATRAGGFVEIDSEVGHGTAVRVCLPTISGA